MNVNRDKIVLNLLVYRVVVMIRRVACCFCFVVVRCQVLRCSFAYFLLNMLMYSYCAGYQLMDNDI